MARGGKSPQEKIAEIVIHNEERICGFFLQYRWLSNFELVEVEYDGIKYPSTENAYQAAKCKYKEDRRKFTTCTPKEAKKLSHHIEYVREDWHDAKYEIMYNLVMQKYLGNKELGLLLQQTGDRYLEETNYWGDTFWGVCEGVGFNSLGVITMLVRDLLNERDENLRNRQGQDELRIQVSKEQLVSAGFLDVRGNGTESGGQEAR